MATRVMAIGFTGTQEGMSPAQAGEFENLLRSYNPEYVCVGECIGADYTAAYSAYLLGVKVCVHPPTDTRKVAPVTWASARAEPLPYLERNHAIVDHTDILIAAPKSDVEEIRSGTWATVRYARKQNRSVIVLKRGDQ